MKKRIILILLSLVFLSTSHCYLEKSKRQEYEDGSDYPNSSPFAAPDDRRTFMLSVCAADFSSNKEGPSDLCLFGMALFAECANKSTTRTPMIWHP